MDSFTITVILVFMFLGGLLGFTIGLYIKMPFIGVLRIIRTSEEKDIYRFEFKEIDKLDEKKYAVMLIKTEDSQEIHRS